MGGRWVYPGFGGISVGLAGRFLPATEKIEENRSRFTPRESLRGH